MYRLKTTQEIETVLNNWLSGGATAETEKSDGVARGAAQVDELDNLTAELKSSAPSEKKSKKEPAKKQSLDDAFADLMNE